MQLLAFGGNRTPERCRAPGRGREAVPSPICLRQSEAREIPPSLTTNNETSLSCHSNHYPGARCRVPGIHRTPGYVPNIGEPGHQHTDGCKCTTGYDKFVIICNLDCNFSHEHSHTHPRQKSCYQASNTQTDSQPRRIVCRDIEPNSSC